MLAQGWCNRINRTGRPPGGTKARCLPGVRDRIDGAAFGPPRRRDRTGDVSRHRETATAATQPVDCQQDESGIGEIAAAPESSLPLAPFGPFARLPRSIAPSSDQDASASKMTSRTTGSRTGPSGSPWRRGTVNRRIGGLPVRLLGPSLPIPATMTARVTQAWVQSLPALPPRPQVATRRRRVRGTAPPGRRTQRRRPPAASCHSAPSAPSACARASACRPSGPAAAHAWSARGRRGRSRARDWPLFPWKLLAQDCDRATATLLDPYFDAREQLQSR